MEYCCLVMDNRILPKLKWSLAKRINGWYDPHTTGIVLSVRFNQLYWIWYLWEPCSQRVCVSAHTATELPQTICDDIRHTQLYFNLYARTICMCIIWKKITFNKIVASKNGGNGGSEWYRNITDGLFYYFQWATCLIMSSVDLRDSDFLFLQFNHGMIKGIFFLQYSVSMELILHKQLNKFCIPLQWLQNSGILR